MTKDVSAVRRISDKIADIAADIPHYLTPFFIRSGGKLSFMDLLLFDGILFSDCTKDAVFRQLKNKDYFFRKYIEHYLPGHTARVVRQRISKHPDGIDMIKTLKLLPEFELYIYYTILRYDEVLPVLHSAFERVYAVIENEHSAFIPTVSDIVHEDKLRVLSGVGENESLQYAFTLTEPHTVLFRSEEPSFFLLGSDYENVLETEYKYIGVTPYSFAQAIGSPTKYAIYRALLKKSPLTRIEMELTLHLSRSALDHNLKDMRQSGLVVMSKRRGETFYYELDTEFVKIAAGKILADTQIQS